MASTIKVTNIDTPDNTGNITVDRPLSGSGASLTNLPAANLTGTIAAISGANLTNLNGSNIASGTVADARISALTASKLTGALPAISGASLTNLPAEGAYKIISGAYAMSVTGSLGISGVGFQPKAFMGFAATGNYINGSWGISCQSSAGVESAVIYDQGAGWADQMGMTVDNLTLFHGSAWHKWTVNSFDSDGITVTRSNHNGSPLIQFNYRILFIK